MLSKLSVLQVNSKYMINYFKQNRQRYRHNWRW